MFPPRRLTLQIIRFRKSPRPNHDCGPSAARGTVHMRCGHIRCIPKVYGERRLQQAQMDTINPARVRRQGGRWPPPDCCRVCMGLQFQENDRVVAPRGCREPLASIIIIYSTSTLRRSRLSSRSSLPSADSARSIAIPCRRAASSRPTDRL